MGYLNETDQKKLKVIENLKCPEHGRSPKIEYDGNTMEIQPVCCEAFTKTVMAKYEKLMGEIIKANIEETIKGWK